MIPAKKSLAFKIASLTLLGTACIFFAVFFYNYAISRQTVLKTVEDNTRYLTLSTVHKIENTLLGIEKTPLYLAASLESQVYTRDMLLQWIENVLNTNPEIFGATVAYEPFGFDRKSRYYAPYICREDDKLRIDDAETAYNYFFWDWYLMPKELGRPIWSEPYFDTGGGNIVMTSFSVPFYRKVHGDKVFSGIVTADLSLKWLKDIISEIKIYQSGYAFLISQSGVFVSHPDKDLIMNESIFSIAEAAGDMELRNIGRDMIHGKEGFVPLNRNLTGKISRMYYAPLQSTGWSVGVVVPEDELFAALKSLTLELALIGAIGFILLFLVIVFISGKMTRPISALADKTVEIAMGNLDIELPASKSNDEIGELTTSFENMRSALKEYIIDLKETTAIKERIESELKIAHTIQMSFLPKHFPPFPEKQEFDIYAALIPAKEVGGDLYDFFLLDDRRLFFSIGDVSGKGVPAALFMAVTKTLMKGIASENITPSDILERTNRELCVDNDSMMFCTVFCGILNFTTGELAYANAGHNPPLILKHESSPQWLVITPQVMLGVLEDVGYKTQSTTLEPGESLILYTDGVTEAMDHEDKLYSNDRLIQTLEMEKSDSAQELVENIILSVREFVGAVAQSDDITVLALTFNGDSHPDYRGI
ncbi:MAG: SpoIIE family protein phosphatase [Deltaproteobacteria bacterium]|nr:SpoIIE family protein phosphatase [Deltaproteobacteria bacterium]